MSGVVSDSPKGGATGISRDAQLDEALTTASRAASSARHISVAHARLSEALMAAGRRQDAVAELKRAKTLSPGRPEDSEALAFAAFCLGEHQLAFDYYAQVVQMAPQDAMAWYNLATSQRNLGHLDLAELSSNEAIERDPALFAAYLMRSNLHSQTPVSNHIRELTRCLERNGDALQAQILLNYALGKELDDLREYDSAFLHFERGATARRRTLAYRIESDIEKIDRIIDVFDAETLKRAAPGDSSTGYVFILGLPRSGTTLIERILTGNPSVRSNGETDNLSASLLQALNVPGRDVFERAARANPAQIGRGYVQRAGPPPAGGLVLEKLPLNYLYVGLIHMALPNAKLIVSLRNPLDNCFGMYSILFGSGYPFSYDLAELARYYAAYDRLMRHWAKHIPGHLLETSYEELVESPSSQGPIIADHAGLAWSDSLLKIEQNTTASATASAEQIRRPIYRSAAGRWRHYAKHLHPLSSALRSAGLLSLRDQETD